MMSLLRIKMEDYKGRHIGCAPGTHAALTEIVLKHIKPGGAVLDIGTHAGALLLRLQDAGFSDLTGADLDPTRFDVPGADFKHLELNAPFSEAFDKKFRLITSTDVIEHLDSPRNFLEEAYSMLEDDGWLALSLPNIASWQGRIKFFLKGELWGFGTKNYISQRHISPITAEQMTMMMQEVGLQLVAYGSAGSFSTPLMKAISAPAWMFAKLLPGLSAAGECAIYLAKKAKPDVDLKQPFHYRKRWQGIPDGIGLSPPTT
jgi:2-polyprenyl-3-methyl-5-hydroxy-6-metoxy-1,4-benzoquinol methylase